MNKYFEDSRDEELFNGVNFDDFSDMSTEWIKAVNSDVMKADEYINFPEIIDKISAFVGLEGFIKESSIKGMDVLTDKTIELVSLIVNDEMKKTDEIKLKAEDIKNFYDNREMNNKNFHESMEDPRKEKALSILTRIKEIIRGEYEDINLLKYDISSFIDLGGNIEDLGLNSEMIDKIEIIIAKSNLVMSIENIDMKDDQHTNYYLYNKNIINK